MDSNRAQHERSDMHLTDINNDLDLAGLLGWEYEGPRSPTSTGSYVHPDGRRHKRGEVEVGQIVNAYEMINFLIVHHGQLRICATADCSTVAFPDTAFSDVVSTSLDQALRQAVLVTTTEVEALAAHTDQ